MHDCISLPYFFSAAGIDVHRKHVCSLKARGRLLLTRFVASWDLRLVVSGRRLKPVLLFLTAGAICAYGWCVELPANDVQSDGGDNVLTVARARLLSSL